MSQKSNILVPISIVIAGGLVSASVLLTNNRNVATQPAAVAVGDQAVQQEQEVVREPVFDLDGWPSLGDESAPVTIVEYSDYFCPFCKRFSDETKPLLSRDYIESGVVRFVRKDFITVGGNKAAEAAHCAGDQGAYWDYHDHLYVNQAEDRGRWGDAEVHRAYANELGLDADKLVDCFVSGTHSDRVAESSREAANNGGSGTPLFFVNGIAVSGAQPFSVFEEVIQFVLDN